MVYRETFKLVGLVMVLQNIFVAFSYKSSKSGTGRGKYKKNTG